MTEVFAREASRGVRVQRGDQIETISKLEAVMRKVLQKAMEGDLGAARLVMLMASMHEKGSSKDVEKQGAELGFGTGLPDEDTLRRMIARFDHLRAPVKRGRQ